MARPEMEQLDIVLAAMKESLFKTAERAVLEFEAAGGEFSVEQGRISLFAAKPSAEVFRAALAKVERRRKLVTQFLLVTRGAGPALGALWQADAELRVEWVNLERLEAASDLAAFNLIEKMCTKERENEHKNFKA